MDEDADTRPAAASKPVEDVYDVRRASQKFSKHDFDA